MARLKDRLPILLEEHLEDLPKILKNAADPVTDRNGSASSMVLGAMRFIGVAKYTIDHDVAALRSGLIGAATIRFRQIERFESGEPISKSYVTMLNYKAILDALAAGDLGLAKSISSHIGGRTEIEKEHDHPFDYAFGYAVRSFVLDDREQMKRWSNEFGSIVRARGNSDFVGYSDVFESILSKDVQLAQAGLNRIITGHMKQSKRGGVFENTDDEVLCLWGIAVANLARLNGLAVRGVPPLIPDELLCY